MIAAVDENNGLGLNNKLLCHLPADLQHFKQVTIGCPIIMGRKTFQSIGRPLPGRTNIVLSQSLTKIDQVTVCHSLKSAIEQNQEAPELFIIGGAEIYAQAMPQATRLYITRIHHQFNADTFFPDINKTDWHCKSETFYQQDEKNKYPMTFYIYERNPITSIRRQLNKGFSNPE